MKVRVTWEFEADVEDLDPKHIDVPALAKELTRIELADSLSRGTLTAADFEYSVVI